MLLERDPVAFGFAGGTAGKTEEGTARGTKDMIERGRETIEEAERGTGGTERGSHGETSQDMQKGSETSGGGGTVLIGVEGMSPVDE